jgi:uncharacterized membrane protein
MEPSVMSPFPNRSTAILILVGILVMGGVGPALAAEKTGPVSVEVTAIHQQPDARTTEGTATVTFTIQSGPLAGDTILYSTHLWGHPQYDPHFEVGKSFTGTIDEVRNGEPVRLMLHNDRKDYKLLILFGVVTVILMLVGRWEGVVGLFSTVGTILMIFYVFFPLIQIQDAIFPVGVTICLITIVLTVSFVMKWDTPTIPAIGSLVVVFFITLGLTILGFDYLSLNGSRARHSRLILTWIDQPSSLWRLLTIGIVLGSLGAMMDVAVVISSTVNEIVRDAKDVGFLDAFRSGITVGREILSTMVNTLVFAYMGILFPLLLSFRIFRLSWLQFVNYDFVGIEILRICVGLVGLSLVIPTTALMSAWWCRR